MNKNSASQSGILIPRVLAAFALCSLGVLLAMFSLAETLRAEMTRINAPPLRDFAYSPGTTAGGDANRLPPGVPLPPGTAIGAKPTGGSMIGNKAMPSLATMPSSGSGSLAPNSAAPTIPLSGFTLPAAAAASASWGIVASPNASGLDSSGNIGVTCVAADDCWAVGSAGTGTSSQTLIEHWDGRSWAIVPSPNATPTEPNILYRVTCVAADDCWAVGSAGSTEQTLTEHWNGSSWAIVNSPNASPTQANDLRGVTCVAADDCWAVGYAGTGTGSALQTLTEHWNGSSWAIVSSPNNSTTLNNVLFGVTCAAASDCWAVGYAVSSVRGTLFYQTLTEHWNGSSWAIVPSANTGPTQHNILAGVTCVAASDCWAVGYATLGVPGVTAYQTLTEHWNGSLWAIVPSPNANPTQNNILFGVSCVAASDCWAVGYAPTGTGSALQTLTEHWNGSLWAIVGSPNTSPTQNNILYGVSCVAAFDCWAVGSAANQTLTEHYEIPPVPLNSVVSRKTHTGVSDFDINLPLIGTRGIECRSGGATNDYKLVFTFPNNLTSVAGASVTNHDPASGTGTVSSSAIGPNPNQYTVNLTGVTTGQYITVTLNNVQDAAGNSGNVVGPQMGVLIGDTTADRSVNSADIGQTKSQSGNPVTISNFREDVTVDGNLNSADISLVKSKSGTALP